ncbi:hypothetical protein C5O00_07445 [Pukyongia salina]|uniref:DNA primase n=1 Tax=Pukyongia salina TaxID=2094025 RepID=A0A2S0HWL1_9FLAO|nr:hypothetical protein [Pukyongia salina]AVI51018.1 hypothetical protein C5O00_07445 [Pukyongia salina]
MKRIIVDYSKLTDAILDLLVEKYPSGYDPKDIIVFRNAQNEVVECVEVRTDDTIYLVKVSKRLVVAMEDYEDDQNDDYEDDNEDEVFEETADEFDD